MLMWLSFGINRLSEGAAKGIYWAYAVAMGLSLSTTFLVYTGASIASTFFARAAAFGGLSLYGYTTNSDLSGFGPFLFMGLAALYVASLIHRSLQSTEERRVGRECVGKRRAMCQLSQKRKKIKP